MKRRTNSEYKPKTPVTLRGERTTWVIEHSTRGVLMEWVIDDHGRAKPRFSYMANRSDGMVWYDKKAALKELRNVHASAVPKAYLLELGRANGRYYARPLEDR